MAVKNLQASIINQYHIEDNSISDYIGNFCIILNYIDLALPQADGVCFENDSLRITQ